MNKTSPDPLASTAPIAPVVPLRPNAQSWSSMNAPAPTSTARPAVGGIDLCRITVSGPERRADLAIPATVTLGELLPLVVRHVAADAAADGAWVLQRLGGPPLDFGVTAESLDLREGEVLYLSPQTTPLPELEFDDVSVGVAHAVAARADHWRPAFSRLLLLAASGLVAAAFAVGTAGVRPVAVQALCYGLATVVLALGAVLGSRLADDRVTGIAAGLGACAFAVLTGFAARHGASGLFTLDRRTLMIAGCATAAVAVLVAAVGRLPVDVFGAVAGTALCAAVGGAAAQAFHLSALTVAALLATVLYAATTANLKIALRVAQIRVALLPRTAEELQQDLDPAPQADVTARTARAVVHLNALFITCSLVYATAVAQAVREPGWIGWTFGGVFGVAVLLRARGLNLAWQRVPVALSGVAGICLVVLTLVRQESPTGRAPALIALLACVGVLLVAARMLPGRRLLPAWGQLADRLEMVTAIAVVPLLLQLFHAYARFRALIS